MSNTSTHCCPADDCRYQVAFDKLMCGKHWRMVSRPTQVHVYDTYRRRGKNPDAHREAMATAIREVNARLRERGSQGTLDSPDASIVRVDPTAPGRGR